jgi:hypothetical protein
MVSMAVSGVSLLGKEGQLGGAVRLSQLLPPQAIVPSVSPIESSALPQPSSTEPSLHDPLESHFPVPWSLIQTMQRQASQTGQIVTYRHRSPALTSPDAEMSAYADINISMGPKAEQSIVSSQIVLTNHLGTVLSNIPASIHDGEVTITERPLQNQKGVMAILIPIAWSKDGQQLLARQFEAVIGSDIATDYAFIWKRDTQKATTISPFPLNYDTAVLLGWNPMHPNQLLFRTTRLGETSAQVIAIDERGNTMALLSSHPQ